MNGYMIFVDGHPQGKQRPRFRKRGKFVQTYTPTETVKYELKFKKAWTDKYGTFKFSADVPLYVSVMCYYQIPKSFSKKKMEEIAQGNVYPMVKPDIDNVGKAVLDALNKVAYEDDKQIVKFEVTKCYSNTPFVSVDIRRWGDSLNDKEREMETEGN